MKKLILSALMMSLCGSAFANVDFSYLKKGIIDCDHFQIEGNTIKVSDNQSIPVPKDKIQKAQAGMRFQDAMKQVNDSVDAAATAATGYKTVAALPFMLISKSVMNNAPDVIINNINNFCGKSVDDFLQGNKDEILNILEKTKPHSKGEQLLIQYYKKN